MKFLYRVEAHIKLAQLQVEVEALLQQLQILKHRQTSPNQVELCLGSYNLVDLQQ